MPTLDEIATLLAVPRRTLQRYYAQNRWPTDVLHRAIEVGLLDASNEMPDPDRPERPAPKGRRRKRSLVSTDGGVTWASVPRRDHRQRRHGYTLYKGAY